MGPFGAAEAFYLARLAWIRAQIAIGNVQTARSTIKRQLNLAAATALTNRVIELTLLEVLAAQAGGDQQSARQALERALLAAQPEGYIRIFDQGSALTQLLVEAAGSSICRDYIGRILAAIGLPNTAASKNQITSPRRSQKSDLELFENLSEREVEVLRLMAQGATNHAIAQQLVITVGTVKSHINHILGKLDAHNRTEAVARARRFGLV
jgi:LuxR family maltose regulon positive regulatory protein